MISAETVADGSAQPFLVCWTCAPKLTSAVSVSAFSWEQFRSSSLRSGAEDTGGTLIQGGDLTTAGQYWGKLTLKEQHTCVLHCTGSPGLILSPTVGLG